jgi:hypothetical protein
VFRKIAYIRDTETFQLAYHHMWYAECMYSHAVLSATLYPFLCTAAIRKIIVTLFVRQDDILTA